MDGRGRSSFFGRCQGFQQGEGTIRVAKKRRANGHNLWILAGVMLVSAFCGTLFLMRFAGLSRKDVEPNTEVSRENKPLGGFLESAQCSTVCYTKGCMRTAVDILEMLDPDVSPCDDFYQYACGRFKRDITDYKTRERYMWSVEYEAIKLFQDLIKQMPQSVLNNTFGSLLIKLKKFYDSCMDIQSSDKTFATAFKYLEYFGIKQWPYINHNYEFSSPDLDEVFTRMFFYNLRPFFHIHPVYQVDVDETGRAAQEYEANAETMNIQLATSGGVLETDKTRLLKEILETFVPNNTIRDTIATEIFTFRSAVSGVSQRTEERMEQCRTNETTNCSTAFFYNCTQRGNQKKDRWCRIAENILERSGFLKKHPTMLIRLEDGEHFLELSELLDSTDQRIIAHTLAIEFFVAKVASENFGLTTKNRFQHAMPLLKKAFNEKNEYRSAFCVMWPSARLPKLAEMAFYYTIYHNSSLRKEINEMYEDIKDISYSTMRNISWIDAETKDSLEELFSKTEFSPEIFLQNINISGVAEIYQEVEITEESFLANDLESEKLEITLAIRNIDTLVKDSESSSHPLEFNPQYHYIPRTIFLEFGNFMLPVIAPDRPRYANLGTLGFIFGHEFGHAAQHPIRLAEKSEAYENALRERQKCLEDEFFKYEVYDTGEKVNGNETFPENLADFLGIRAAFKSLKKYKEKHGDGKMLPGLRFNDEQLFFIIATQTFCEENNEESQQEYLFDRHSPPYARINGMLRNFDAFSTAFSCAPGSPMNPVTKCSFE